MNLANHSISGTKSQLNAALSRRKVFAVCAIGVLTAVVTLMSLRHSETNAVSEPSSPAIERSEGSAVLPDAGTTAPTTDTSTTRSPTTDSPTIETPIVDYTYN